MEKSGYYAVIPAPVRYDETIPDGAKLLFGEISALCNEKGFCWASNAYFAELYKKSADTISRWVSCLEKAGYIICEVEKNAGNARKIYIASDGTLSAKMPTIIIHLILKRKLSCCLQMICAENAR